MPHTDGGETLIRKEFSHRLWPTSPDKRVVHKTGCESLSQLMNIQGLECQTFGAKARTEHIVIES